MPHKFYADRRDKIPKQKYRLTNWAEYNESLRRGGDLTVWISEEARALWSAPRRTKPGDRTWSPQFRTHRLNYVSGSARSELEAIRATRPQYCIVLPGVFVIARRLIRRDARHVAKNDR